jgi:hypothetical protein
MSAFVTSLSELAALIIQSFRLPALLPAAIFVVANAALVLPGLKDTLLGQAYYSFDQTGQTLILAVFTTFIAYSLAIVNLSIIRWCEGYPLLEWPLRPGRWLQNVHQQHYLDLKRRRDILEHRMQAIQVEQRTPRPDTLEYWQLESEYQSVITELTLFYPSSPGRIAPTRLGNVIAAAEDYPHALYEMDAVLLWPLLAPTLTEKGYAKFIEREKAAFDFLLNMLVLLAIVGLEIAFSAWLRSKSILVLALQLLAVMTATFVLYRLSIDGAVGWALTIRASFDLYRDHMRQALRIKQPEDFGDERRYWKLASLFYGDRRSDLGEDLFDYSEAAFRAQAEASTPSYAEGSAASSAEEEASGCAVKAK